jgi:hypothetical protein
MKADVTKSGAPKLRIPAWVPKPVAHIARQKARVRNHRRNRTVGEDVTQFLTPLVQDQRMRRVWHELLRRRRDGTFMHPAAAWWIDATNAEERQGVAMAKLLTAALQFAARPGATSTRRKAERMRNHNLEMARHLRADADALRVDKSDERWYRLIAVAETYEGIAKNVEWHLRSQGQGYYYPWPMVLDRDRRDPADRWLACAISYTCRSLFCSPLYGITAIIMTVILGREIARGTVRQWCADKTKKNPR